MNEGTALSTVAKAVDKHPLVVFRERLEARADELKKALPSDITPAQFIRALTTAAQINPDLLACSFQSLWLACMRSARDGLLPDGSDGAIVAYKDKATWIPMYQGLLRRFRRSGQFHSISAHLVRQGEPFDYFIDENGEHLKHRPGDDFNAPIERIYSIARTRDGGVFINVMTIDEANKIRKQSRATREDSPWRQWPEQMYLKTTLRRLLKMLPQARDLIPEEENEPEIEAPSAPSIPQRAIGVDAALEQFAGSATVDDQPATGTAADEGGAQSADSSPPQHGSDTRDSAAADNPEHSGDPIIEAYKRGKEAKSAGNERRVPPEYYNAMNATNLAQAFLRGWDGQRL